MGKGFISALLFWKLKILRQKYFHRKPRISVWEGCPAVAQSACPTDLSTYASLGREGDKTHFHSNKHKTATKEVINVSSCILLCCLSKLYREVECFTTKLWKQPAPASQFQLLLFSACCAAHQNSLDKIQAVSVYLPLQVRVDSHILSMVQERRYGRRFVLVYSQHISEVRGNKFVS